MSEDEVKPQKEEEPTPETVVTKEPEENEKEDIKEDIKEDGKDGDEEKEEEKEEVEEKEEKEDDKNDKEDDKKDKEDNKDDVKEDNKEEQEKQVKKRGRPKKGYTYKEETEDVPITPATPATPTTPGVPLYDQPLEMSGKRDRKKVERFIQEEKKEELKIEGTGTPLGDIPFIEVAITKSFPDELRILHRVAYSRPGASGEIKKNLKKFNGLPYTKDDKKYESKVSSLEKVNKGEITKSLKLLGLEVSGSKGDVIERLLTFMLKPADMGKKPPKPKKRKSQGGRGRKKSLNTSKNTSAKEASDDSSSEANEEDDEEEEAAEEEEVEEKKKKAPPKKKAPAKKPTKRASSGDSDSESDDEPLAKKVKQPPNDNELRAAIKKILDGANLEEVTMKSVCRQVYENYPDFDLTHKKDFIKETVKSIIS